MVRRVLPLTLSLGLLFTLGMARTDSASAQEVKKAPAQPEAPKVEAPKKEEAKVEPAKKEEAAKKEPEKAVETPPPTVPKAVEEKLEAARRAVAEAIVKVQRDFGNRSDRKLARSGCQCCA